MIYHVYNIKIYTIYIYIHTCCLPVKYCIFLTKENKADYNHDDNDNDNRNNTNNSKSRGSKNTTIGKFSADLLFQPGCRMLGSSHRGSTCHQSQCPKNSFQQNLQRFWQNNVKSGYGSKTTVTVTKLPKDGSSNCNYRDGSIPMGPSSAYEHSYRRWIISFPTRTAFFLGVPFSDNQIIMNYHKFS